MIEIRPLANGDEAVFATAKIRRGTRIAAEVPLIMLPPGSDKEDLTSFCKAVDKLGESTVTEITQITCRSSVVESIKQDNHTHHSVWRFYKSNKWVDNEGRHPQGKKLQKLVAKTINVWGIYFACSIQLGPGGKYGSALFSLHSRLAHSCCPNAYNSWNPTLKRLTIHATRDIKAGDQICVDYTGNACQTNQQRAFSLFTNWGITCNCAACTDPEIRWSRSQMLVLDQALAAYQCGASIDPEFEAIEGIPRIVSADEALKNAEKLAELFKKQKLYGMELCKT